MRKRVLVHGQVQGVFFRDSVSREAHARKVAGWVRNCEDGTVEAVFEGREAEVMVAYCRTGPPGAEIDSIEVFDEEPEGLDDFSVR